MRIRAALYLAGALLLETAAAFPLFSFLPSTVDAETDSAVDKKPKKPDLEEAAFQARRLVHDQSLGYLNTVYQHGHNKGFPFSLPEYYADCDTNGTLTLLIVEIGVNYDNWQAGSPVSFSIGHTSTFIPPISPASQPRVSLQGSLSYIPEDDQDALKKAKLCFLRHHPDSRLWFPGNAFHNSSFAKFDVKSVYWVGGFGHESYVGEIPVKLYSNVTLSHPHVPIPFPRPPKHGDDDGDGDRDDDRMHKSWFDRPQLPFGHRRDLDMDIDYVDLQGFRVPLAHHYRQRRPCPSTFGRPRSPSREYDAPRRRHDRPRTRPSDRFHSPDFDSYDEEIYEGEHGYTRHAPYIDEDRARAWEYYSRPAPTRWGPSPPQTSGEGIPEPIGRGLPHSRVEMVAIPVPDLVEESEPFYVVCGPSSPSSRSEVHAFRTCLESHMEPLDSNQEHNNLRMHDAIVRCQSLMPATCTVKRGLRRGLAHVGVDEYPVVTHYEVLEPEKSSWFEYVRTMFRR
ncbi:pyridoxamine 5'-phosphate oxidase-domain-containing protein [Lipomyces tetrasporus]|uniref:Pyridoxamine 5'-phosphate oxidase-domain-containing protein n=1 Tax=Lipomyces tetrasporus TaxID=54092 RepID=A0AAD7VS41_9ASCO|nr:pyridoxamine 5'-phosphate oxidase-domain-containing protein [Lipomyces tetrasporus]KAJ8100642.1 pyridoxamine 5'-phosphate oxidase-domain-containing protein [Lipomyces tetrasporus]